MGNLEGIFCDGGSSDKCQDDTSNCYAFQMPSRYVEFLDRAGFDFVSLANNHSQDFGDSCLAVTESLLDERRIAWSGRPGTVGIKSVHGVRVGFIAFHSGRGSNSSLQLDMAETLIQSLKQEVDIILVSVHGGAEGPEAMHLPDSAETYLGEPRGYMRKFAHRAIDAGADLVFGHGPHVARAMELYQGRLIAYSLGNFATYGRFSLMDERQFGGILVARLDPAGKFLGGRIEGTVQRGRGVPIRDGQNHFGELVSALTLADLEDAGLLIDLDGSILPTGQ